MKEKSMRSENAFRDAVMLVSHRCLPHVRALRFANRREAYRRRLVEAVRKGGVVGLDYLVAPTGLYAVRTPADPQWTSALMRVLQSGATHDLRRAAATVGSVWRDRHAVTFVQNGLLLLGVMLAINLHLVAEEKIRHPAQWGQAGWSERVGIRKRYRTVRQENAAEALHMHTDAEDFTQWYID